MKCMVLMFVMLLLVGCATQTPTPADTSLAPNTTTRVLATTNAPQEIKQAEPSINPPPTATAQPTATTQPSPTREPTPEPTPTATLEAGWQQDSDVNAIPDIVEEAIGTDPQVDDCAAQLRACADPANVEAVLAQIEQPHNVMLLLDASGSMAGMLGSEPKIDVAKSVVRDYVNGAPSFLNLGLLLYGHTGDNTDAGKVTSCAGAEVLASPGTFTAANVDDMLARFQPTGWTPIANAVRLAGTTLNQPVNNHIIVVSDGLETCDGDPVAEVEAMQTNGISVTVDVIGFDIEGDDAGLRALAAAGHGTYYPARSRAELDAYFDDYYERLHDTLDAFDDQVSCIVHSFGDYASCCTKQFVDARSYISQYGVRMRAEGHEDLAEQTYAIGERVTAYFEDNIEAQRTEHQARLDAALQRRNQLRQQVIDAIRERAAR